MICAVGVDLIGWVRARDGDLLALRRAGRAAIVMPGLFAIGEQVIGNPTVAAFAAFGSFSMLLLASFTGPMADRIRSQAALALAGGVLVVIGTLVSTTNWLAAIVTALVAFGVLFSGVLSSVLAGATTALLLALILPVSLPGAASTIPDRLAGWGMAAGASVLAITLLWPSPTRDRLRDAAVASCRALAARLRTAVAEALGEGSGSGRLEEAGARAQSAAARLQAVFFATPYRPTALSTSARVLVRLVDELAWLNAINLQDAHGSPKNPIDPSVCAVKANAAAALESSADLLEDPGSDPTRLHDALDRLGEALLAMERDAIIELPSACRAGGVATARNEPLAELVSALDPTFRAQELSFVTSQIGANVDAVAAAERRGWLARLVGREPAQHADALTAVHDRAASHVSRDSVWLHNSLRGAFALGLAVLIASVTGAEHSFWVVLGTLSVLRSNALSTGQNALRGLLGTVIGFAVGAGLVVAIGPDTTVLWVLLAPAILVAGFAPAAISFAAGQGAFTVTLVILYNILQPAGWRVGLVRVEDVALGCAISLLVGVLFWPRGAGAALGNSLARAYRDGAQFLSAATAFAMGRCDSGAPDLGAPLAEAARAAAAARRLDDTFRTYLAERSTKSLALAEVTNLLTGVAGLRLAAEAILDLWQRDQGSDGDRAAARHELVSSAGRVADWYEELAAGLSGGGRIPDPLAREGLGDGLLLGALERDLSGADHLASATAVRMIWTGDHLDAARRLQATVIDPARKAAARRAPAPPDSRAGALVWRVLGAGAPREPRAAEVKS
jgi:uncharacterized membrane protein YccC